MTKGKQAQRRFNNNQKTLREENELIKKDLKSACQDIEEAQSLMADGCYLAAMEQLDAALITLEKHITK